VVGQPLMSPISCFPMELCSATVVIATRLALKIDIDDDM